MKRIRFADLPIDVQQLLRTEYGFRGKEAVLRPVVRFECPTSYCDANTMTVVAFNQRTGEHKSIRSGWYESASAWSREEWALYNGSIQADMADTSTWFFVLDTYPKPRCTVYCHPDALALAIEDAPITLTRRQEIVLYITRAYKSFARWDEARTFRFSRAEYDNCKAELHKLGLLAANGSLTLAGKNRAAGLHFNCWEEDRNDNR